MAVLELERVHKTFRRGFIPRPQAVLHDLSFAVEEGEVFGFLGPNGAGKTTTIKVIVALLFADRGQVRILGHDSRHPRSRESLGFLPENPYFYDYLSGKEFLDFYGRLLGLDRATRQRRGSELLERLGLARASDLPLRRWSKGMVQRLAFAQTLLGEPRLLVLDEPMSGLDPIGRRDIRDLILEARSRGTTVFFSSHILQDAEMICDRVAILAEGRLRSLGRLAELLERDSSGYEITLAGSDLGWVAGRAQVVAGGAHETLVRVPSLEAAEALAAEARERQARMVAMVPARATLEELFLREVKGQGGAT